VDVTKSGLVRVATYGIVKETTRLLRIVPYLRYRDGRASLADDEAHGRIMCWCCLGLLIRGASTPALFETARHKQSHCHKKRDTDPDWRLGDVLYWLHGSETATSAVVGKPIAERICYSTTPKSLVVSQKLATSNC